MSRSELTIAIVTKLSDLMLAGSDYFVTTSLCDQPQVKWTLKGLDPQLPCPVVPLGLL